MYRWENPIERAFICAVLSENTGMTNFRIMPFCNFTDDYKVELYTGDVCELQIRNEFGSISKELATVGYLPPLGYTFVLGENKMLAGEVVAAKYIGNLCENPAIMDTMPTLKNDYQSITRNNRDTM